MRNVEITAHDNGFGVGGRPIGHRALFKPLAELAERIVPLHSMVDACQLVLSVGGVDVDKPQLGELERTDAPLVVEIVVTQAVQHLQRLALREHSGSRIALALRIAPEVVVSVKRKVDLPFLAFRLLKREHISIEGRKDFFETLLHDGANTVDVPRHESHFILRSARCVEKELLLMNVRYLW